MNFLILDSSDIMTEIVRSGPVAIVPDVIGLDGLPQTGGFTDRFEYVFDHSIPLAEKLLWPPIANPGLQLGDALKLSENTLANRHAALAWTYFSLFEQETQ